MTGTKKSWRDVLKIHPAAELFPLMSAEELRMLGEDIKANGLKMPIALWAERKDSAWRQPGEFLLLDGRNRLDAMEFVGMAIVADGKLDLNLCDAEHLFSPLDPYDYVISANIHRRHLTSVQKGEIIAALLKERPERSDRETAKLAKVDHKTVAAKREKLEVGGEIPHLDKRAGADGKAQPASKPKAGSYTPASRPPHRAEASVKRETAGVMGVAKSLADTKALGAATIQPTILRGQIASLFHDVPLERATELIEAIRSGLQDNAKRLAAIPNVKRLALARGLLAAIGVTVDDLKPIGLPPAPAAPPATAVRTADDITRLTDVLRAAGQNGVSRSALHGTHGFYGSAADEAIKADVARESIIGTEHRIHLVE